MRGDFLLFSAHLGDPYFSAPRRLCIDCIEIDIFFIVWTSKLSVLPQHRQFCEQWPMLSPCLYQALNHLL